MLIRNKFQKRKVDRLSKQVFHLIKNEPKLTNRSLGEITKWIEGDSLHIALEGDQILGFIAREKITNNFYEVKSLLVRKEYRRKGLGDKLMEEAVKEKEVNYLISTFQEKIVRKAAKLRFKKTSFIKLPLIISLTYISTKKLGSVLKHGFKKKSYLLVKYASN